MSSSVGSSDLYHVVMIPGSDGSITIRKYCKKSGWIREEEISLNGKRKGKLINRVFFREDGQTDRRFNFGTWNRKFRTLE